LATISGGAAEDLPTTVDDEGMAMLRSGFAKRASTDEACSPRGVRARFFVGRFERGSADVGMDSGMGSDMVAVLAVLKG
jgi:hypothetical protein